MMTPLSVGEVCVVAETAPPDVLLWAGQTWPLVSPHVQHLVPRCGALRLARFNVLAAIAGSNKDFYGVPSPAAAAVVTFFVWSCVDDSHSLFSWISGRVPFAGQDVLFVAAPLMLATALSMVSSIRYNSFKKLNLAGRMRFLPFAAVVGVLALVAIDPPRVLFLTFFAYALSGPVMLVLRRFKKPAA